MLWISYITMSLLLLVGVFLIFIILLQRGRGGGLAGALGGMGGQSAFGTKAGDFFTRVTVVLAIIWIVLCAGQIPLLRGVSGNRIQVGTDTPPILQAPEDKEKGDGIKLPGGLGDDASKEDESGAAAKDDQKPDGVKKSDGEKPDAGDSAKEDKTSEEKTPDKKPSTDETPESSQDQPDSKDKKEPESKPDSTEAGKGDAKPESDDDKPAAKPE